ncbi:MAG: pantoate--beta-alanine ligase [Lachnospiraceae bacterium]
MQIINTIEEIRGLIKTWKTEGMTIGLVPTMGYLHAGHKSLIDKAVSENRRVVVSNFVNPIQFGENEDLSSYPRNLEQDAALCENAGADIMFCPKPEEMYYPDKCTFVDMNQLTKGLCGKTRPVHFSGVCTVVTKLFNIVTPDRAYFGEKDAQQLAVIKRMVRDLNFGLTVVGCPIVREADGLALSSRNTYLNREERKAALILNSALTKGKEMINSGETNAEKIKELIVNTLLTEPLARIDYVEIVDGENLEPVEQVSKSTLIAIAVLIGKTRLIDNVQYR